MKSLTGMVCLSTGSPSLFSILLYGRHNIREVLCFTVGFEEYEAAKKARFAWDNNGFNFKRRIPNSRDNKVPKSAEFGQKSR